ncbi:MAG: hypothetical protein HOD97_01710 [Candidatus Marinimicrobia bacterium]|jgi:hypothetical protein|nr:hypothetical protein [Candidatus Neomarinimicrobiota bacterium]MBT3617525.1 hypothetical protein [Candidatus Neomarinimicrobiota bacterium]MBT4280326.1 hypothetical protein [Candidatus Neomarinimicrobiota bacterium]MBT4796650.1 hypothetical protein [Candidatus Neomarinimicrobiota bacterium]MBT6000607.1 hypothetical protein [Candidatus Neomarinimicrobiota bacterium]
MRHKKNLIMLGYLLFQTFLFADGPYSVGIITEADGLRNGPDYQSGIVYYPIDAVGPFPTIVMVPGFMRLISSIETWGPFLASYGIVTMFVNVNWIWEFPMLRAYALLDGIVTIEEENDRTESPLFGNLALEQIAVGGWSQGGGGALLAASLDSSLKSVLALAPWLESEYASPEILNIDVPVIFISGENDEDAPNVQHTNVFFAFTPETTNKLLFEIAGGSHWTVTNPNNNVDMGLKALYWIENFVRNDPSNCDVLLEVPPSASIFATNVECQTVGDLNSDESIDIFDVLLIVDLIINSSSYNGLADFNGDDSIDMLDVSTMVNFIMAGL